MQEGIEPVGWISEAPSGNSLQRKAFFVFSALFIQDQLPCPFDLVVVIA